MDETIAQRLQLAHEMQSVESEHAFARRVLVVISGHFDFKIPKDDPEIGMGWFHENYPSFPVKLEARNVTIESANEALKSLIKSDIWEAYKEVLHLHDFGTCGVVLRFSRTRNLWVIHNGWRLDMIPGVPRLVHPSTDGGGSVFEPLDAFLKSVKKVWST